MENEDNDKLTAFVKSMIQETDEVVEGLLETIERLAVGNPRFTKKERQMFSMFFHAVISQMAVTMRLLQDSNKLRIQDKRIKELTDQAHELHIQNDEAMLDILRGLRELLLDNRKSDAIDLLTKIINYKDNR